MGGLPYIEVSLSFRSKLFIKEQIPLWFSERHKPNIKGKLAKGYCKFIAILEDNITEKTLTYPHEASSFIKCLHFNLQTMHNLLHRIELVLLGKFLIIILRFKTKKKKSSNFALST